MAIMTHNTGLYETDSIPAGLLDTSARNLHEVLPGPTLIHLTGRQARPLFVSVLLHGNESTGLEAIQRLLRKYTERALPRSLSIFLGNIEAARVGLRRLDAQPDYNRVWPGTQHEPCRETAMMAAIVEEMTRRHVFASIDVHNNTGLNPHYACVTRLEPRFLRLASTFGRLVIYFTHPKGTQTAAFAALCPAVTLECGKPEQHYGVEHAFEYLDACLHLSELPEHPVAPQDIDLYHTVAQVTVRADVSFGFDGEALDLRLNPDLDHLNFTDLHAGTVLGTVGEHLKHLPVHAFDETGQDVGKDFFVLQENRLALRKHVMPSMFTLNELIIRQDCLCYLMEKVDLAKAA